MSMIINKLIIHCCFTYRSINLFIVSTVYNRSLRFSTGDTIVMHSTSNNNGTEGYLGKIDEALTFIRNACGREYQNPSLGVICGSGLGGLGGRVKGPVSIEYSLIPGFPVSTITGHQGRLLFGFFISRSSFFVLK